jgi:hypothetical protein
VATVALVIAWLAVVLKAPGVWRRPAPPARLMLWLALTALALGWTLRVPDGYHGFDGLLHVPNLAQIVGDVLALGTGCAIVGMLLFQSHDDAGSAARKLRRRALVLAVVVLVMSTAFVVGRPDRETNDFVADYARQDFLLAYYGAYLAFLAYVFADLFWLCRRHAAVTTRRPLRIGLGLISTAGALGLLYVLLRAGYLVASHVGYAGRFHTYGRASSALIASVTLLAVVGASLPALAARWTTYRSYRQLAPLWSELRRASPGIALELEGSRARALVSLRELRLLLHSRIIEIRDGRRSLRSYFRRDVVTRAQRLARRQHMTPTEEAITVEAATLAAAIDDKLQHRPAAPADQRVPEPVAPGGADLKGELTFLMRVTHAFSRLRAARGDAESDQSP